MTLIPKGPLKKSMSVLVTSYCEKPAASGDMSFGRVTTSKKSESQYRSEGMLDHGFAASSTEQKH